MAAGIKSDGRRAETQTRAKLGELGHLHTLPLYPTRTSVSLSDLEEISPENGKGGNKACPREVQLLSVPRADKRSSQRFPYILERGSQGAKQSSPAPRLKDQRDTESTTVHSNFTLDSTSEPWHRKSMSILPVEHFSAFDLAKFLLDSIEGEDFMTCAAANWQWLII